MRKLLMKRSSKEQIQAENWSNNTNKENEILWSYDERKGKVRDP